MELPISSYGSTNRAEPEMAPGEVMEAERARRGPHLRGYNTRSSLSRDKNLQGSNKPAKMCCFQAEFGLKRQTRHLVSERLQR